ncbi:transposable element Tcb2 transposase [Trichonephila clavipes]|nr:transposable element Tcb2 transposase [Trichonephila clavipes]
MHLAYGDDDHDGHGGHGDGDRDGHDDGDHDGQGVHDDDALTLLHLLQSSTGERQSKRQQIRLKKDLIDELKIFGMSSRHHIDDFMRGRIIGKIEEGRKITDVAREFDIAHSVVSRLWKSFKTTGMCSRRHGGGRVRSTTPAEDRYIVLSAKMKQRTTAQQHRTARLQWCRGHHNWAEQDWACVLFSDESRFSLSSDCRRQLIWRESGTAYRPENIQEKDRYLTCSIMVWAGIMINGRTRLHVVANGTMTGERYIDEVLLPHVRLFRGAVGDKFVFMDDNATCHRTLAVQNCLDSEGIQHLVWPERSPDLNPIENMWDAFGRQVAGRNYPPTNKNTLIRALTEEWNKLPQQLLDNVVQKKSPGRLHTWKNDRKAGGGRIVTSVAAEFEINNSAVSRAWKAFQTTGTAVRKVGGGRPRTTTAGDDRYIILQAKRGRRQSASVIAQQLSTATGRQVSRFTVARRHSKPRLTKGAYSPTVLNAASR